MKQTKEPKNAVRCSPWTGGRGVENPKPAKVEDWVDKGWELHAARSQHAYILPEDGVLLHVGHPKFTHPAVPAHTHP